MDNQDYPLETSSAPNGQDDVTAQETAREQTEELLRNAGLNPEHFYVNFEFVDKMLQMLLNKTSAGFHILKVSFPGNDTMVIIKDQQGEIQVSENVSSFATHVSIGMIVREAFGIEMRSYLNGGDTHPDSLGSATPQEIRGWVARGTSILPLTSQQCIDLHCTDSLTGKFLEPERNVAYRDGLDLVSESQDSDKTS